MKKLLLFAVVFAALSVQAQEVPFNGLIINDSGKGIKAKVAVKHSKIYTAADKDGKFGLMNMNPDDTLVVTVKRSTAEIPIGYMPSVRIVWNEGKPSYDADPAIAAEGMDYVKRRGVIAMGSGITGDVMVQRGFIDLADALLTMSPNVTIINNRLAIRGEIAPALLICDGGQISNVSIIPVEEVESVQVLRSPNIYGQRGKYGVIVITTKKSTGSTTGYPAKM